MIATHPSTNGVGAHHRPVMEPVAKTKSPLTKYQPFAPIDLPNRQWPSRTITAAPIWCSVDLRDGNQALAIPMSVNEKLAMFQLLVLF